MAQLTIREKVWREFEELAKRKRRKPEALAESILRDYIQRIADEKLMADSRRDAQSFGIARRRCGGSNPRIPPPESQEGYRWSRKLRTRVVLDTNVFVRHLMTSSDESPNSRVVQLWYAERRLQLVISAEVVAEYLTVFADTAGLKPDRITRWRDRFENDRRCSFVGLARRFTESRDPDDNIFLATAWAGRAEYLITNDRDLLEVPEDFQRRLPFDIVTPTQFLQLLTDE